MKRPTARDVFVYSGLAVLFCVFLQGWDSIVSFLGIVLTAIVPLVLGAAIAYVVAIPTSFLERHMLPNSTSKVVANMRRPVSLVINVVAAVAAIVLCSSVLVPALIETFTMVQRNSRQFILDVIAMPVMEPVRGVVQEFLDGDFMKGFQQLDVSGAVQAMFGGTMGTITTQVFTVVSGVMTCFFGMLFSFILLTDTSNVGNRVMEIVSFYLGPRRTERIAMVLGVADASFHNFIVRQCIEAVILGLVATIVLLATGFRYALGVGVLMGAAAFVPIVGYPIGLFVGAFMVAINNVGIALLYVLCVATAQVLEATFVLPYVGDPRTVLPPVWVTVGVTIGGGVAGFVGMIVAIPIAATLRQLVLMDVRRRANESGTNVGLFSDVDE